MNYFYASNGLLIKKNIIENLEMEDVSNDWNIDNDIIFIDVNYDLDTFFPQIYTQIVENNIISEKYLFSVIKNPENKSFRVTIHISVDDKLNFVKDNLSLNYLVIG